jgi:hypothetical protein
MTDET